MLSISSVNVVKENLPSKTQNREKERKKKVWEMMAKVRGTAQANGLWKELPG